MVPQTSKTLRVKFEKTGKLKYISHLDLLRTMQTALRRAKVDMEYSEGFNPHMKITFALPLSVGIESVCEFMDLKVKPGVRPNEVMRDLGANLPSEMKILDVYESEAKFTDIKYASYRTFLDFGDRTEEAARLANEMFKGQVTVLKKTKSGEKEVDISPMIKSVSASFEYGMCVIESTLCADSANYLNPYYLDAALSERLGQEFAARRTVRIGAQTEDGKAFR